MDSRSRCVLFHHVNGQVDLRDSAHWGITADFTVRPNAQVGLLYNRQDSDLTFRQLPQPAQEVAGAAASRWVADPAAVRLRSAAPEYSSSMCPEAHS